jgi:DnaJ-class molecular chaperone
MDVEPEPGMIKCRVCNGLGTIGDVSDVVPAAVPADGQWITCPECGGSGQVRAEAT